MTIELSASSKTASSPDSRQLNYSKISQEEGRPPEPFELVFGGSWVIWNTIGCGVALVLFLWMFFRIDITQDFLRIFSAAFIYLFLFPLMSLNFFWGVRGLMFSDPRLKFDGESLHLVLCGKSYKCIDSNWYDLPVEKRLSRSRISLILEKSVSPSHDVLFNRMAVTGGGRRVYVKPIAFESGNHHFQDCFAFAMNALALRRKGD